VRLDCEYTIRATGEKYAVEEIHIHTVKNWRSTRVHILFDYTPVLESWKKQKKEKTKKGEEVPVKK